MPAANQTMITLLHSSAAATDAALTDLPMSKDDVFFGVRAYDKDGYQSPAAFAGAAKE